MKAEPRGADALVRGGAADAPSAAFAGRGTRRTDADEGVRTTPRGTLYEN